MEYKYLIPEQKIESMTSILSIYISDILITNVRNEGLTKYKETNRFRGKTTLSRGHFSVTNK